MKLTGVEETTLIPLWARAYETTRKGEHLIEDPTAAELINKIDYDFSKFWTEKRGVFSRSIRKLSVSTWPAA